MDHEIAMMLRSIVGELGIVVGNFAEAQRGQLRAHIASEQMAALWTIVTGDDPAFAGLKREDVAAEAVRRADALLAALEAIKP